jgi:hypothetical protein
MRITNHHVALCTTEEHTIHDGDYRTGLGDINWGLIEPELLANPVYRAPMFRGELFYGVPLENEIVPD